MTTWGVSMVKDEADVIAGCLRHLADEVDHLLVADNASTDGTRDLLADLAHDLPLTVVDDPDPAYYQSAKMTRLAEQAAAAGADWIVPFDADELWIYPGGRIRDFLRSQRWRRIGAFLTDHVSTRDDPSETDPFLRMQWRRPEPSLMPKVAFRWEPGAVIHQGNHGVTLPRTTGQIAALEIRHFQWRNPGQFVRKVRNGAAGYRATTLPATEGAHWRVYGDILDRHGEAALIDWYRSHHCHPTVSRLVHDPAPYLRWR